MHVNHQGITCIFLLTVEINHLVHFLTMSSMKFSSIHYYVIVLLI